MATATLDITILARQQADTAFRTLAGHLATANSLGNLTQAQMARLAAQVRAAGASAGTLAALEARLRALQSQTNATSAAAQHMGHSYTRALGAANVAAGVLIANVASAAWNKATEMIGGAVSAGVSYNAMLEEANLSLVTIFGSQEAANKKLAEFQAFAAKTPFRFPDVLNLGTNLARAGVEGENLIPTMRNVSAVIAGTGGFGAERMQRINLALNQILTSGRVFAQDANQLFQANVPVWDILAEHFSMTVSEVKAAAQEGTITATDFFDAMATAAERRGWTDKLEAASKTFSGAMSNIGDVWDVTQAKLTAPLFKTLTEGAVGFAALLQSPDFQAPVAGLAAGLGEAFKIVKEELAGFAEGGGLQEFAEGAGELFLKVFRNLDVAVRGAAAIFGNLGGVVGGFAGFVGAAFEASVVHTAAFAQKVGATFGFVGDILGAAGRSIEAFATGWGESFRHMLDLAGTLGQVLQAAFTGNIKAIPGIIEEGFGRAAESGSRARDAWMAQGAVFANIGDAAENYGNRLDAIDSASGEMLSGIAERGRASGAEWATASRAMIDGLGGAADAGARDAGRIGQAYHAASDAIRAQGPAVDALGGAYEAMSKKAGGAALTAEQLEKLGDLADKEKELRSDTADRIGDIYDALGESLADKEEAYLERVQAAADKEAEIRAKSTEGQAEARARLSEELVAAERSATDDLIKIDRGYAERRGDFAERAAIITREADEQRADLHQRMLDRVADAEQRNADRIAGIHESHADRIAELLEESATATPLARLQLQQEIEKERRSEARDIAAERRKQAREAASDAKVAAREQGQELSKIAREEGEKREGLEKDKLKAAEDVALARKEVEKQLLEDRVKAEKQLGETLLDIAKRLTDQLSDIDKGRAKDLKDYSDDRVDLEEDASDKIADARDKETEGLGDIAKARAKVLQGDKKAKPTPDIAAATGAMLDDYKRALGVGADARDPAKAARDGAGTVLNFSGATFNIVSDNVEAFVNELVKIGDAYTLGRA